MQPPEGAADWFRIDNSTDDPESTDVYVYGSIGGFWGIYADEFIEELQQVTTSKVNLRLNSGGGSVFEGVAVANAIRAHPANFTVYVDSLAASIASVIMLAGDRVVMMPQSQVMCHNASGACFGEASEMTKMADLLDRQTRNIADAYAQRTGRPVSEWLDMMSEEAWFSAQEAVDIGLADEIFMPPKKEEEPEEAVLTPAASLMNRVWDLSMYRYAGREQAPEPKVAAKTVTMHVELDGQDVSEHVIGPLRKAVEDRGGNVTAALAGGTTEPSTTQVLTPDPQGGFQVVAEYTDQLLALIRSAVREELDASAETPAADNPPQPDDSPAAEPTEPAVEPPAEPVAETPPVPEEIPPDDHTSTTDQADAWDSLVGLLHVPTSPSADDVFAQLKEGW